jgi:pyruvate/2-oxoglutarate dehydrogenase complex dihydrolipoamide dehydrogenase (E3) component
MVASYDLVVIGEGKVAGSAAIAAAQTHARVAWAPHVSPIGDPFLLLREGARRFAQIKRADSPQEWRRWTDTLMTAEFAQVSPSVVQSYGVEYIEGAVRFEQDDVWVGERRLRSRSYLLTLNPEPTLPSIKGIHHPKVWTIPQLWVQLREQSWPKLITVLGNGPQAIELSQSLRRLGLSVLLITGGSPLLPKEDDEVAFLLQSYLEGDHIQVETQGTLRSIQSLDDALVLEVGNRKYSTEALVIATEGNWRLPTVLEPLNLAQTQQGIAVNGALQTSNPRIYAIGALLGGYPLPSVALQEARLAVQNALFEKRSPIHYHYLPYAILSDPALARVGLTEVQTRRYDPQVQVVKVDFRECSRARLDQAPVGLCKVLVQKDGTILGAHILGEIAEELIHLFALAMQQELRLQGLGQLGYVSSTFTQVVQRVSDQWWQQQHRRNHNERWFYNRRQKIR